MKRFSWLYWIAGIVLIGNFVILTAYGDTLRSTHLFIVRGTVFYPVAYLNLILGIVVIGLQIRELIKRR